MSSAVDDEDIIEVLSESDDVELTTTAVADELPISRGYTRTRLQRLVDDGRLERRREGNSIVWWLPERAEDGDPTGGDPGDADADADSDADAGADADAEAESADAAPDDADEGGEDEAQEADDGPQSVEVEAVASEGDDEGAGQEDDEGAGQEDDEGAGQEDDEGAGEEELAAGDGDGADEADEKPATATGTESAAAADDSTEPAVPSERPTVRVREHDVPASRGGPDSLAKLLGVAALVLLVFALLRRLRRR